MCVSKYALRTASAWGGGGGRGEKKKGQKKEGAKSGGGGGGGGGGSMGETSVHCVLCGGARRAGRDTVCY